MLNPVFSPLCQNVVRSPFHAGGESAFVRLPPLTDWVDSMTNFTSIGQQHQARFGTPGSAFRAPGRVNLIGEHTDTSEGFVMPAALDLETVSVISASAEPQISIASVNFDEKVTFDLLQLPSNPRRHWSDYPLAVLWSLRRKGIEFDGFEMTLAGNVPLGAGLSSSASVEVAVAIAVLDHAGVSLDRLEIAKLCQYAENNFIGARSGIMDQFASCCGAEGRALLLDCRSLEYEELPLPEGVRLILCNTMVKHSVSGGGEYNERRAEVEEGVALLRKSNPAIRTLRDVSEQEMRRHSSEMSENVFRRCLHVVTEDARVERAASALRQHEFAEFGQLMYEAHASMRDNYAASCAEADVLVELAAKQPGCFGARITGAGFGGCTVNLVAAEYAEQFAASIGREYRDETGIQADIYLCSAADGAGALL